MNATQTNYTEVMSHIEAFKADALKSIAKRQAKKNGDTKRDAMCDASIEQFQKVVDFNGTDDESLKVLIGSLVTELKMPNSNSFISLLNMYQANK